MTFKAIVTDIEGTTSSISFVHEVLFPYAAEKLEDFVLDNKNKESVQMILKQTLKLALENGDLKKEDMDCENNYIGALNAFNLKQIIDVLLRWIKEDKKLAPLKDLQGLIWEAGYKNEDYKGHIYEDAYLKLKEWQEAGIKLYIYSSGSIKAQQLLFEHTEYGDLTSLFSGNFDTKTGIKKESDSYRKIHEVIKKNFLVNFQTIEAEEILFLSDSKDELNAAQEAGFEVLQLVRKGVKASKKHKSVKDFSEIEMPVSALG